MKVCDNTSVGVLTSDATGRLLMFQRVKPPFGVAPVADAQDTLQSAGATGRFCRHGHL